MVIANHALSNSALVVLLTFVSWYKLDPSIFSLSLHKLAVRFVMEAFSSYSMRHQLIDIPACKDNCHHMCGNVKQAGESLWKKVKDRPAKAPCAILVSWKMLMQFLVLAFSCGVLWFSDPPYTLIRESDPAYPTDGNRWSENQSINQ